MLIILAAFSVIYKLLKRRARGYTRYSFNIIRLYYRFVINLFKFPNKLLDLIFERVYNYNRKNLVSILVEA